MTILGNLFMVMFLWGIFTFTIYAFRVRKTLRKYKDDPNIKGVQIINGEVEVIKKEEAAAVDGEIKEETKDMVYDMVCEQEIEKSQAFHVIRDEESHYFCSWECREQFIKSLE